MNTKNLVELKRNKEVILKEFYMLTEFKSLDSEDKEIVKKEISNFLDIISEIDLEDNFIELPKLSQNTEIIIESFTG